MRCHVELVAAVVIGLCFSLAVADGPALTTTTTTTSSHSDPIVLIYGELGCQGPPRQVNLVTHRANRCLSCWDRCEENQGGMRSYRLVGSGRAAIAWNCVGMSASYNNANFARGGIFDSSSCHSPGGGGTVVLCSSSFEKAVIAEELANLCNLTSPNIGLSSPNIGLSVSVACFKGVSVLVSLLSLCFTL